MKTLPATVTTKTASAARFSGISLSSMDPKDGMKLAIAVDMRTRLLTRESLSLIPGIRVVRSTGSFMAIARTVREKALREKYLHGTQSFLFRMALTASTAMASEQAAEAAAVNMPIHGIGDSILSCKPLLLYEKG
ncbi:glutamate-ammonia-ligase adenylyltransferase [Striga asiatica]|uniref:Glutamate-ammonia-ligase adenylyltransferase n=1 Tax=Striga asiatica TaxID=4170 RepID=A0A5A7QSA0_STRAF|nr:glutamate-ammonia-ligase adenylyltransferase [Striga asiatica]